MSQHLTPEDLARLVDDAPTAHEAAHLGTCRPCRTELDAMREDVQALSMLPDMAPVRDSWDMLEQRLRAEGLVRTRTSIGLPPRRLLQVAAAIVLFVAGSLAGRITTAPGTGTLAEGGPAPAAAPADAGVVQPLPSGVPAPVLAATDDATERATHEAPLPEPAPRSAPRGNPSVTLASNSFELSNRQPRSMEEAIAQLREAEEYYLSALTRYAELATQAEAGDPVARLAALQSIVMTTQAALNQTPTDPVINGYHLTALAQRDATLRQVAAATDDRVF